MAAANTDKLRKKRSNFSTTLNGSISDNATTIALNSASGLPTDTAITITIDRIDANGVSTPSSKERVTGVVSSNNLTNCLRGEDGDGGVGKSHSSGAVVEDIWDADTWNDMIDAFLAEHSQAGAHSFTNTVLVTPRISTSINDSNGNEAIRIPATTSAVNDITTRNAATAGDPSVEASGDDTNISILVKGKGTGKVKLGQSTSTGVQLEADQPVLDSSGNEQIKFVKTASAVNEVTVTNAATAGAPKIAATGDDTNIHLDLRGKGNGLVKIEVLRQDLTTNAYKPACVVLTGWSFVLVSAGGSTGTKAITFGITFSEVPVVVPGLIGIKYTTAPTVPGDLSTAISANGQTVGFGADTVAVGGFGSSIKLSSNAGADSYFGFGWIAVGVL